MSDSAYTQPRVIEPDPKTWAFAERERELFDSAKQIPSWRVANQARRHLAGMLAAVTEHMTSLDAPLLIADADADLARKVAVVNLGVIIVRSTSSIIALVGCGHEREALMHARVSLEAVLRGRQIADDSSGESARQLLSGRRYGSLKSVAQRYGDHDDVEFLDRFAHADPVSLLVVGTRHENQDVELELLPARGGVGPINQLFMAADQATLFSLVVAEVFGVGVQIPPYLASGLKHFRDHPPPKGA
jgi:hypothetical protein